MGAIKVVTIAEDELRELIRQEATIAVTAVLASQPDELLNIGQICDRIPGMTRYLFANLVTTAKLKNVRGRYSLKAVKAAVQSQ